jgi:exosortase A-associated hydrolase 2
LPGELNIAQQAFHLPARSGWRFCIWRAPARRPLRGLVLHVPAFAEEMNKSRRMTAMAARDMAASGFGVLQVDLLGCGDSCGDFGDATWDAWIEDLLAAFAWLRMRSDTPVWLWSLRAGALLASAVLPRLADPASMLLWQPVVSGKQHLTQFLRLKLAADALALGQDGAGTRALRERLASGQPIEVGGYRLAPALADGLERAEFPPSDARMRSVAWLEVRASPAGDLSPAARSCLAGLESRGIRIHARSIHGPGFWQTVEIEECPDLVAATTAALECEDEGERELSRDPALL